MNNIPLFWGDDLPLSEDGLPLVSSNRKNGLRVLSLFDGISTGKIDNFLELVNCINP